MTTPVALEDIRGCLQGMLPSSMATCAADGIPNVTYLSIVQYVDRERVATSRQFLNKTRANLDANPYAQVMVVDAGTQRQYALDLRYLHTETEGEVFETMRANLEAIASQTGMGDVFRLRGVDIFRVERCAPTGSLAGIDEPAQAAAADLVEPLDRYVRRLMRCTTYDETTQVALHALDDLFGVRHAILLAADAASGRLFAIASSGYPASAVGAEVEPGAGLIGTAAARRRMVTQVDVLRSQAMASAVKGDETPSARDIPLPGLPSARSATAIPLAVGEELLGVLYLESERAGAFSGAWEPVLRIVGASVAAALAARGGGPSDEPPLVAEHRAATGDAAGPAATVAYYQADDSVLCDGEYIVKGVPGRILWRLLNDHANGGRTQFTNRELRLDETLGLPAGNDNLEARLLVLRRRLAERACGITLERVGRGRLELGVARTLALEEIATSGPMRAAHEEG